MKVAAADVGKVNPSVPFWGGPTGIDTDGTAAGDDVYTYGNSSLRAGVSALSPHQGVSLGDDPADGGWSHPLYTVTPGVPGDSGSAFLSAGGKAIGTLSTLGLAPLPASNNIGDLAQRARLRPAALGHRGPAAGQRDGALRAGPLTRAGPGPSSWRPPPSSRSRHRPPWCPGRRRRAVGVRRLRTVVSACDPGAGRR